MMAVGEQQLGWIDIYLQDAARKAASSEEHIYPQLVSLICII